MCSDCEMPDHICDCERFTRPVKRAPLEIRYAKVCLPCEGRGYFKDAHGFNIKAHCAACNGTGREEPC